jgi:hypothetical protein
MLSFLFFNTPNISPLFRLYEKYSQETLTILAYNASHPKLSSKDSIVRNAAFEFCFDDVLNISCSIVTYHVQKDSGTINDFYLYLSEKGSCNDMFSSPNWNNQPPVPLFESYKSCRTRWSQALLDAAGIAFGNASSLTPLCIYILVLFISHVVLGIHDKYTIRDKETIIDKLAQRLLTLKKWKRLPSSMQKDDNAGILQTILDELENVDHTEKQAPTRNPLRDSENSVSSSYLGFNFGSSTISGSVRNIGAEEIIASTKGHRGGDQDL